jgi:hypothetical protein
MHAGPGDESTLTDLMLSHTLARLKIRGRFPSRPCREDVCDFECNDINDRNESYLSGK